jgi:TetR/AcrR family transcriptional repressor of nem operon
MSRVSRTEAQANRRRIIREAAQLFRDRGITNVSVADIMEAAGLTHGGFYKHFPSKTALVDEAAAQAFTDMLGELTRFSEDNDDHHAAWQAFLDYYLSTDHRDHPGDGCPAAGFAGDFARQPEHAHTYAAGIHAMARWIAPGDDGLTALAHLVGSILLARATAGTPLSHDILHSAHTSFTDHTGAEHRDPEEPHQTNGPDPP